MHSSSYSSSSTSDNNLFHEPSLHFSNQVLQRFHHLQRDHSGQVSFECQEELFRQEVENADDIRLSQRLVKKCMADKKKFCNDVKPGMI